MSKSKKKKGKKQKCVNPGCNVIFTSNKHAKGHQECCGLLECKRYLARERQKKYYKKHSTNEEWVKNQRDRKKKERNKRESNKKKPKQLKESPEKCKKPFVPEPTVHLDSKSRIMFTGMISLMLGTTDASSISETIDQCKKRGQDLFSIKGIEKKMLFDERFPNASSDLNERFVPNASSP